MHHAPPVSYPVGRCLSVGVATVLVGAAGVAVMAWWAWRSGLTAMPAVAVLAALASAAWALRCWAKTPAGVLGWDGHAWRWSVRADMAGLLTVSLDLQRLLLLRWQVPDASASWLWLERKADPQRWTDLRRAVYSRANPHALPDADSPAANP